MKPSNKYKFLNPDTDTYMNIFDVDDTLVITDSKIKVFNKISGKISLLSTEEFKIIDETDPKFEFDFTLCDTIESLIAGKIVRRVFKILKDTLQNHRAVGILTARSYKNVIYEFLLHHNVDVNPDFIFAVGDGNEDYNGPISHRKKEAFRNFIKIGFRNFRFFDDNLDNLKMIKSLENEYPEIEIKTEHINIEWTKTN